MPLLGGVNHVATLTADLDRLRAFYEQIFEAETALVLTTDTARHAFIVLGPDSVLHPYEIPGNEQARPGQPMFDRGRIDHIGLNASSREAFEELRRRLVHSGASEGVVTDYGAWLSVHFIDPDGMDGEVCWLKPGSSFAGTREPISAPSANGR